MCPDDRATSESEKPSRAAGILAREWTPGAPPEFIRAFSNHVYELRSVEHCHYLRVSDGARRSLPELTSELDFVQHLARCGIPVSEPVPSRSGKLVHSVEVDGDTFHGIVFRQAPGVEFKDLPPQAQRASLRHAGRTIGRLHAESLRFKRPVGFRRWIWSEDRWGEFAKVIPETEREAWEARRELQAWLQNLPRDSSCFGLIHGDFTILNMRISGDGITLFDFDSCCDHWFAYEIATFLHYFGAQDRASREEAYHEVLDGYAEALPVDNRTLAAIPLFGKMRLLYSFLVFAEEWGFEGLSPEQAAYFALRRRLLTEPPAWPAS